MKKAQDVLLTAFSHALPNEIHDKPQKEKNKVQPSVGLYS